MARLSSRDGGGTERGLGLVVLLDVVLDLEMPVPPEVTEHPPDGVLYDLTDLARSQVTEFVPHQLGAVFVISPVEEDHVQMRIEPHVAGRALHDGHRAALDRAARASARSS
ncbi:hypothetical protein POL72_39280 [Sorangium sp. wiwo2]|uniref:Uncharacterized protein n=2 Tax=Sorangium atrum TaxID=2995308 RepID=A0ABT5CDH2_9BACT|nr:hypothetical protein [Sorangium aterium]MDC0683834.1 hypothetical protein [Sorangium aterium]